MAERRMFAKCVVNSARFLRMPQTARLLYYDLGMTADDDGVVEAFVVIQTTGAKENDLQTLSDKGFLKIINDDLVCYICDWSENNRIRKDRYKQGRYRDLIPERNGSVVKRLTNGCQMGDAGKDSIREDSIGEDSIGKNNSQRKKKKRFIPPTLKEVTAYCVERKNGIDAERFIDWYASRGWCIGKNKMTDWRAAVRTWERNNKFPTKTDRPKKEYTADDL